MQKNNYLRKTLALVMAFLMIVTMMPVNVMAQGPSGPVEEPVAVPGTSSRAVDGPDWEVSDKEAEADYWSLSGYNRLLEVSKWDPIKNPTIEYKGSYNLDDREVITLVYKTNSSASAVWKRLLLKFDKTLYQMIDWDNTHTRAYKGPVKATGSANPKNFKGDSYRFTLEDRSLTGSDNVVSIDLNDVLYKENVIEAPMHFVLKSPTTLDSEGLPISIKALTQTREPIIQSRIVDNNYERVFMIPTDKLNGYSSYTSSTIIPSKDYRAGLIPESQQDNRVPWAFAQNSFISYNKKEGYVDLTIRQTKDTTLEATYGKIIGLRTVIDNRFFDTLAGSSTATKAEDPNAKIADVFIIDKDEIPYDGGTYENPVAKRRINVLRNQINKRNDGLSFIQVVGTKYVKTAAETSIKMQSKGDATGTLINSAPNTGEKGVGTVVRFYVNKDKFEKLINNSQDLLNLTFYTTFTRQTQTPKDTFTGTVDKDRKLKKGDRLILDFGQKEFTGPLGVPAAGTGDRKMTMEIGERPHTITFFSHPDQNDGTSLYWRDASTFWWNIPYDMTLKEGTPIKIYAEGIKTQVTEVKFYPNLTQYKLGDKGVDKFIIYRDAQKNGDMQFMRFSENMKSPHVAKTQNEASIPEIFTEDSIFYGHTKFGNTIARASGVSKDGTDQVLDETGNETAASTKKVLKQAYFSDPNDVVESAGEDSYISEKYSQRVIVNKKLYNGYEFSTKAVINPDDPLGVVDGAKYKNDAFNLVKDAPIAFTTEDYSLNAVEKLPPIIEQVQAKVKFDLNGGYLGEDANDEKAKKPIVKIAPLNKNYRYVVDSDNYPTTALNKDYVANAFEGDNRRMVYPLKEVRTIVNGYTRIKYEPDTSREKVMASHTDMPLGTDVYKTVFDKFEKELQQKLAEAQALPAGTAGSDTRKVRDGAIAEAQKDIDSFKEYVKKFYTDKGIDITKSQLWLREFPGKESQPDLKTADPKSVEKGKVFLGWATRPLTQEESDKFASMEVLDDVKKWEDVDAKPAEGQTTKAYKFTENSPIDKERTVYAVWGQAAIILHSNVMEDGVLKDKTVIIPFTNDDKVYTEQRIDTMSGATVTTSSKENLKKNSTVKRIPLVPYKFDSQPSSYDPSFKEFAQTRSTFVGWTTTKYDNDATSKFKAGLNNPRLAELDAGKVADTGNQKKSFLKKAEMLTYLEDNPIVSYLPNGMDLYIHESLDEIIKNGKQIHLYANYRPYFNVNVKPSYKSIENKDYADKNKDGNYGDYKDDVANAKKHDIDVALLYRTAVTDYSDPTVAQTATYNAINEADLISGDKLIKHFVGTSKETLTWSVPGFDKDGKRLSYVAMVLPKGKTEADYKAFNETKWKDFGITVNVRKIIDWDQVADANVPKNLHRDAGDIYGGKLAKTQVFTEKQVSTNKTDAFTSATSRKSDIRQGSTNEVNGYTIVMTNTPESLTKPIIKTLFNTDKAIKLDTSNVNVDDVKTITLRVPKYVRTDTKVVDGKTVETIVSEDVKYTFTKNDQGKYVCTDPSITAEVDTTNNDITIKSFDFDKLANKFVYATYANDAVTSEEGNEMIQKRLASNEVTDFEQVENKGDKPVVEMTIPGGSGNPANPSKGTKYVVEKLETGTGKWKPVSAEKVLGDEDRPGDKIKLDITGTVAHDDQIRIVAKELNKTETASKKTIKLDLKGPAVSGKAEDDAFRMFIDIKGILDELPKEGTLKIEVGTKGPQGTKENMIIDNIDPTKEEDKKYLVERLSYIPRNSITGIWVTASDKFDNKTENKVLPYNPTKQIEVQYLNFRANKSKFYMFIEGTEYKKAKVNLTVIRGSETIELDQFEITNVNTRYTLTRGGQTFKLQKDDILKIKAVADDGAYTNPHEITIK